MTEKDTQTRLWQEITGMVVAAVILVMVAWLLVPEPLVGNPTQTELLSIRVEKPTSGSCPGNRERWCSARPRGPL